MSKSLVVTIPHHLGKNEAMRRVKTGIAEMQARFGQIIKVYEETWSADDLQFCVGALGQQATGKIEFTESQVHLQLYLPWLLAKIAGTLQPYLRKEGALLLEKK